MLSKIYNLLNYCYEDSMLDKFAGIEFQLFIISTKSLLPYEDKVGCMFDVDRYKKEMEIFPYYKNGKDDSIDFYQLNKDKSNIEDKLLEYKIIPVAISNMIYSTLIEEVLKIVLFFTTNNHTIINSIIITSVINEYLNQETVDIKDIKIKTKERLIDFSLKEYLGKNNQINIDKNFFIGFEKERIKMIVNDDYFNDDRLMKYKALQFIINNLQPTKTIDKGNETVLDNFSSYLLKIRKGTLNPEKLKYNDGNISDLKEYLKSNEFTHPLLGKCIVIRRSDSEIILKNKLGLLRVNI